MTEHNVADIAKRLAEPFSAGDTEALRYFETHNWMGDFCWHQEETKRFVEMGIELLRKEAKA